VGEKDKYWGKSHYNDKGDVTDDTYNLEQIQKHIFDYINLKNTYVLDVGCGNGRLASLCQDATMYVGLETADWQLDKRYNFTNTHFLKDTIFSLEAPIYDYIFFIGSFYIHYEYGYLKTLRHAKRILLSNDYSSIIMMERFDSVTSDVESFEKYNLIKLCSDAKLELYRTVKLSERHGAFFLRRAK